MAASHRAHAGFSIIELSIILVVLAFIITNALIINEDKKSTARTMDTYEKMDRIQQTLTQYVKANGHYPCPANGRARVSGDVTYGVGQRDANTGNCLTSAEISTLGIFRVADANYSDGFNDMVIGVLPTADLALPTSFGVDQWGNRITYGVIQRFTKKGDYAGTLEGDIRILNEGGDLNTKTAYVLISHGANGMGAWPFGGGTMAGRIPSPANPPVYIGNELENHHMDTNTFDKEFFRAGRPNPNAEGHKILFDDIVRYQIPDKYYGEDTRLDDNTFFSPESIPGLVLWLDGKYKQSIEKNANSMHNVVKWRDRTSNFNNDVANDAVSISGRFPTFKRATPPTVAGNLPTFPFKQAIDFGPGDVMRIENEGSISGANAPEQGGSGLMTLFIVGQSEDGLSDNMKRTWFGKLGGVSAPLGRGLGKPMTGNSFGYYWGDPTMTPRRVAFSSVDLAEPHAFAVTVAADGTTTVYDGCNRISGLIDPLPVPFENLYEIYLGGADAAGEESMNGNIGEVIMYNHVLQVHDIEKIIKYLDTRWGLKYNLANCNQPQPSCPVNQGIGEACSSPSTCCSAACSGGKCCLPTGYSANGQKCKTNADCCDAGNGAVCSGYGFCWMPPRV